MCLCLWWNTHEGHSWTAPYSGPGLDSGLDQRKDSQGKKASGWVTGESEGTTEVLLTKARSGIPDSGTP